MRSSGGQGWVSGGDPDLPYRVVEIWCGKKSCRNITVIQFFFSSVEITSKLLFWAVWPYFV